MFDLGTADLEISKNLNYPFLILIDANPFVNIPVSSAWKPVLDCHKVEGAISLKKYHFLNRWHCALSTTLDFSTGHLDGHLTARSVRVVLIEVGCSV